jgi:hypothetical protein
MPLRVLFFIVVIVLIALVAAGCNAVEKIIDPVKKERKQIVKKEYRKDGLSFSYPDNWRITEDTIIDQGIRHVNIEDSDNSLFIVQIMSFEMTVDLEEYADTFVKDIAAKIPVGNISGVTSEVTNRSISGRNYDGVRRRYSMSLLGETVSHTVDFFLIESENSRTLLTIQAPDEDRKAAEPEFKVISDSLKFE